MSRDVLLFVAVFLACAVEGVEANAVTAVHIRHEPRSRAVALLLAGWLASRLGWATSRLIPVSRYGHLFGHATTPRLEIALRLAPAPQQRLPGLAGVTIITATCMTLALHRGAGDLHARCSEPRRAPACWAPRAASPASWARASARHCCAIPLTPPGAGERRSHDRGRLSADAVAPCSPSSAVRASGAALSQVPGSGVRPRRSDRR